MSVYKTIKNESRFMVVKKRVIVQTDKIENALSLAIIMLATIGILKMLSQSTI